MDKFLNSIFQMSLVGSYIILIVICVRFIIRRQPKFFSYALWGIVFLKLIFPFSITGNISLIPEALINKNNHILYNQNPTSISDNNTNSITNNNTNIINKNDNMIQQNNNYTSNLSPVTNNPQNKQNLNSKTLNIYNLLFYIWIIGFIGLVLWNIIEISLLKKRLKVAVEIQKGVYEIETTNQSFILGTICPRIYISAKLKDMEREYVLCHERMHLKHHDNIIKPLLLLITCIHWFNPLVWLAFYLMCQDMEMTCDEAVIRNYKGLVKKEYSHTLLNASLWNIKDTYGMLSFGNNSLKSRISNILKYKNPVTWICIVTGLSIICICISFFVTPAKGENYDSNNDKSNPNRDYVTTPDTDDTNQKINKTIKTQGETLNMSDKEFAEWIITCIKNNDKENLSELISYPITPWSKGENGVIESKSQFIEFYDEIITEEVKSSILETDINNLFTNWQGTMLGNGEVWFSKLIDKKGFFIFAISSGESRYSQENDSKNKWIQQALTNNKMTKEQAEDWFLHFTNDSLYIQDEYEIFDTIIEDFDGNGQLDIALQSKVRDGQITPDSYKGAYIYIYINGTLSYEKSWDSSLAFGFNNLVTGDFDNDNRQELAYVISSGGVGGAGSSYKGLLKYDGNKLIEMNLPNQSGIEVLNDDTVIEVSVKMGKESGEYIAYSPYLESFYGINSTISFNAATAKDESGNPLRKWNPGEEIGENCRGYSEFEVIKNNGREYLQAKEYLYGEGGLAHCIGFAEFLFDWDINGNPKIIAFDVNSPFSNTFSNQSIKFYYPEYWIFEKESTEDMSYVRYFDTNLGAEPIFWFSQGESFVVDLNRSEKDYKAILSETYQDLNILELTKTTINGHNAIRLVFTYTSNKQKYIMTQYKTIVGYASFEFNSTLPTDIANDYESIIESVISSVVFINSKN